MSIRLSVGNFGANQRDDVMRVQKLLNHQRGTAYSFGPVIVDGLIGPQTVGAIMNYQRQVVRMAAPDGRVDPGGPTITALERNARESPSAGPPTPPSAPGAGLFTLTFRHGGLVPPSSGAGLYESTVTLSGPKPGTFRGSIYPDDMNVKGRVKDGTYDLSLTFHRKKGVPTAGDLVVKTEGDLRPALTVNDSGTVPVISHDPSKTTSAGINVHNGFDTRRWSEGCLTIQPSEWSRFIRVFLDLYPSLSDWYEGNQSFRGRRIGTLDVRA